MKKAAVGNEAGGFIPPMKALGVPELPPGKPGDWLCEIKFDGYRAVAVLDGEGGAELWSRNRKPLNYPEVVRALAGLRGHDAVLDGEIVALGEDGHADFQALQGRELGARPTIVYYVFDLLHLDGHSLLALPIEERRRLLEKLLRKAPPAVKLSATFDTEPATLLAAAKKQGLEGIILKRAGSLYESDRRSGAWLKVKNLNEQEFVVGGFTPPRKSRQHFGALLVGYYDNEGELIYAGKVGTGFDVRLLGELRKKFRPLETDTCPFSNLPLPHGSRFGQGMTRTVMRTVTWLKPRLVAQIKFAEWTVEGLLRQPVFLGLRKDKAAKDVRREAGAA